LTWVVSTRVLLWLRRPNRKVRRQRVYLIDTVPELFDRNFGRILMLVATRLQFSLENAKFR
jgi:hypothetical protein